MSIPKIIRPLHRAGLNRTRIEALEKRVNIADVSRILLI
jgi:hypothetical protein